MSYLILPKVGIFALWGILYIERKPSTLNIAYKMVDLKTDHQGVDKMADC
jgi:hypothetical protein